MSLIGEYIAMFEDNLERLFFPPSDQTEIQMVEFNPDQEEFDKVMKDTKNGGPREAGRFLASFFVHDLEMDEFKDLSGKSEMPTQVREWLSSIELQKGAMKQIRSGFRSRMSELLDSLERSRSWEGFTGLSEAERLLEIRKG